MGVYTQMNSHVPHSFQPWIYLKKGALGRILKAKLQKYEFMQESY